jgi:ribosomal protein L35
MRHKANTSHILVGKSRKRKRRLRRAALVKGANAGRLKILLQK